MILVGKYRRPGKLNFLENPSQNLINHCNDRARYLFVLRREIANAIIWKNPTIYLNTIKELRNDLFRFESFKPKALEELLDELCEFYPTFEDFDCIGTREHVLYADAVSPIPEEILINSFRNNALFVIISGHLRAEWKQALQTLMHEFNDYSFDLLNKYVQKIEDTKLKLRIEQAMQAYHTQRDGESDSFENDIYSVRKIPSLLDNRFGVHLKRNDQFAIHSFYVRDDGHISRSYYRSDASFAEETVLNSLGAVIDDIKQRY